MKKIKYLIILGFLLIATTFVFANPFNMSMRLDMGGGVSDESAGDRRFVDSEGNYFVDSAGNYLTGAEE